MPAPLSLSKSTIITPTDEFKNVSILVRVGHAIVKRGRDIVIEADVATVEAQTSRTWKLTLVDGSEWTVTRARNCGCG